MGTSACKYFNNNGLASVIPHAVSQLISTPPPGSLVINLISIFYSTPRHYVDVWACAYIRSAVVNGPTGFDLKKLNYFY